MHHQLLTRTRQRVPWQVQRPATMQGEETTALFEEIWNQYMNDVSPKVWRKLVDRSCRYSHRDRY
jgi:hypothetical protein